MLTSGRGGPGASSRRLPCAWRCVRLQTLKRVGAGLPPQSPVTPPRVLLHVSCPLCVCVHSPVCMYVRDCERANAGGLARVGSCRPRAGTPSIFRPGFHEEGLPAARPALWVSLTASRPPGHCLVSLESVPRGLGSPSVCLSPAQGTYPQIPGDK